MFAFGNISLLMAANLLFFSIVFSGQSNPKAAGPTLCGTMLSSAITPYLARVQEKFTVTCILGDGDYATATGNDATISFSSPEHEQDPIFVTHEMLHVWLWTEGWSVVIPEFSLDAIPPDGWGESGSVGKKLEDYLEHRMFMNIMHDEAHLDEYKETMEFVNSKRDELNLFCTHDFCPETSISPVSFAALYLVQRVENRQSADQFEALLKQYHFDDFMPVVRLFDSIINSENPRTQAAALQTVQHCLDAAYGSHMNRPLAIPAVPPISHH